MLLDPTGGVCVVMVSAMELGLKSPKTLPQVLELLLNAMEYEAHRSAVEKARRTGCDVSGR